MSEISNIVASMSWPELPPEIAHNTGAILLVCKRFKQEKALDDFWINNRPNSKRTRHGRQDCCKLCHKRYGSLPKTRAYRRNRGLQSEYGISQHDYEAMLVSQGGGCAICGDKNPGHRGVFDVDHDHKTGKVRGLLCHGCHVGIGMLKDNYCIVYKAGEYLARHLPPLEEEEEGESTSKD